MAITKLDCLILLTEINKTTNCEDKIRELLKQKDPTIEIIKFINDNKELDCRQFYEKIRNSYNNHSSKLYINIVKEDLEPKDVLCCLASLNLLILLYNKHVDNNRLFLRLMRFEELQKVMLNYALTGDIIPCQKLLQLFKADLKVLENISK